MFTRILVPLDGSARAEQAIPVAARIAHITHGSIVFVRVVLPPAAIASYTFSREIVFQPKAFERNMTQADAYLKEVLQAHTDELFGITTVTEVFSGAVSPTLMEVARLEHVDLIVLASHAESGLKRWVFGSTAQQAAQQSRATVLILNEHGSTLPLENTTRPLRVLVPLDGSVEAETAIESAQHFIATWATPDRAQLHLIRIVQILPAEGRFRSQPHLETLVREEDKHEAEAYLKALAEGLQAKSTSPVTWSVAVGYGVAEAIIKAAEPTEGTSYDLIAMATHGDGAFKRFLMGSVTEHIVGHTKLPLLLVRTKHAERA